MLFALCCVAALAAACVPDEDRRYLALRQAAIDLKCAASDLDARKVGDRLFRVTGCGQHVVYRAICKLTKGSCYLLVQDS